MTDKEQSVLEAIRAEMDSLPGHLGLYYKNLVTGDTFGVREDECYGAASVIKLPLFLHVLALAEQGALSLEDRIVTEQSDKVGGCGALKMFTGAVETDIRTLCELMICLSDNTATNRLLRHCTLAGVEQGMLSMGMQKTKIRRFLFDHVSSAAGIQNSICPVELGELLERLYHGQVVSPEADAYAMQVLEKQQINHKMNGKLSWEVSLAHKTGEDDGLSNDVGIVFAPQPFVVCFAGHKTDVYRWEDLIRRATYDLVHAQN